MNNKTSGDYINWDNEWSYPLQWLWESEPARLMYQQYLYRVNLAMIGKPFKNKYQDEINSNISQLDPSEQAAMRQFCVHLPEGTSQILAEAVETRANQMASGVDTYEYQINDPYNLVDADTEDLLAARCAQDYIENDQDIMAATYSRDLTRSGMVAVMVKYNPKLERNEILRINPKNTWWDTMYHSTGKERFRGYSTMIDWARLKKMVKDQGDEINKTLQVPDRSMFDKDGKVLQAKYSNRKIRTLNDLDIYVGDLNRLAVSPSLQGYTNIYWEYDHDLRSCYNMNWYHTFATDPKQKTNSGYNGQDVELTVIYDMERMIEFKIINRRYVISMNKTAFRRELEFPIYNPITDETVFRFEEITSQCPLKFRFEETETRDRFAFPTSPLFFLLDDFDELCALRAKRAHVSKILSILRIEANAADASSLRGGLNIMGFVLDNIQGQISSINFQYSYDPIDSQIAHYEQTIRERLNAYTQFDAMQAMGDRASAAESGMAAGAIAQGLSTHQNNIMKLYADIARQCLLNRVIYSNNREFPVNNLGDYASVTIQQMALNAIITVKSKMSKQIQEKMIASNALALVSNFKDVLNEDGVAYLLEQAMYGTMPRKLAKTFIRQQQTNPQEAQAAVLQGQNMANQLLQNQQMYENNPLSYEATNALQGSSPEEMDAIIGSLSTSNGQIEAGEVVEGSTPEVLDVEQQDGSMALGMEGINSDLASALANANSMV